MKTSVLMSVYNNAEYLKESMESVLSQSSGDFEFIVIDDGSTDDSGKILEEYAAKDARIKLIKQNNLGLTKSLNKGMGMAEGEYIARMDGDDISLPERLRKQAEFLDNHPETAAVGTFARIIDGDNKEIGEHKPPAGHKEIKKRIFFANQICHSSVMFRKKAVESIGGYDENFKYAQDYDLWLRLLKNHQLANIPEFLMSWRKTGGAIGQSKRREQRHFSNKARVRAIRNGVFPPYYKCFLFWDYLRDVLPDGLVNFLRKIFHE